MKPFNFAVSAGFSVLAFGCGPQAPVGSDTVVDLVDRSELAIVADGDREGLRVDADGSRLQIFPGARVLYHLPAVEGAALEIDQAYLRGGSRRGRLSIALSDQDSLLATETVHLPREKITVPLPDRGGRILTLSMSWTGSASEPNGSLVLVKPRITKPPSPEGADRRLPVASDRPNVILYVLDTIRADHLGAYGYELPTSPNFDRWSKGGMLFEKTIAPAPWTRASVASILTGLYPRQHQANANDEVLADHFLTLPEILRDLGYTTAGFITNGNISGEFGFDQGFDRFEYFREAGPTVHLPAADLHREILRWTEQMSEAAPLFLYVHATDPHAPYTPPAEFRERFLPEPVHPEASELVTINDLYHGRREASASLREELIALYDAEIAAWDASFGAFLEELARLGVLENSLVILVGDHGEEFGEHGGWQHSTNVHGEQVNVPLVIRSSTGEGAGMRIEVPVSPTDILPTVLGHLGVDASAHVADAMGYDLLRLSTADLDPVRTIPVFSSLRTRTKSLSEAVVFGNLKLIRELPDDPKGTVELFDIQVDPAERHDLVGEYALTVDWLESLFSRIPAPSSQNQATTVIDPRTRETLEALGYLN